jgi:hypothetical protein
VSSVILLLPLLDRSLFTVSDRPSILFIKISCGIPENIQK